MKCRGFVLGIFLAAAAVPQAKAYVSIRSSTNGAEVHWNPGAQLTFRANNQNSSRLSSSDIFTLFTTSLNRWKAAAQGGFSFIYYQGTDSSLYPNYLGSAFDNSIFFTSNAQASDALTCGTIALTEVWFDPNSGVASKADLRFNDKCFTFTNNPADTVSQQRIYLGDVATHELGHALGLDHSQNLQSTMIYTAAIEMSRPSCDDQAALAHLYAPALKAATGTLAGTVLQPNSTGALFGAHVQAIELERGVVIASALTDRDGTFTISGLEPGHYGLVVEPYFPGPASLSPYYGAMNSAVCSGANFQRSFATANGALSSFAVTAGTSAQTGSIAVSCSAPSSLNGAGESQFSAAPVLAAGDLATPVATQSVFGASLDHYYKLIGQSGHLSVQALSYSLFARSDIQVELLNSSGAALAQTTTGNVFLGAASGYVNYDANASADIVGTEDVYVHVFTRALIASSRFPSGAQGVDGTSYYVLAISRGQPTPVYAANARCEAVDNFAAYTSPGAAPPFGQQSSGSGSSGGCGRIINSDSSEQDPLGPDGLNRLANFAAMIVLLLIARRGLSLRGATAEK